MIDKIESLQEKLEAKTASLAEAYEYIEFAQMPQFKSLDFKAIDLALWLVVSELSKKRPAGKKVKPVTWDDKGLEKIFLPIASRDYLITQLQGVYFDNTLRLAVSTNGHILAAFLDKSIEKRSGNYRFNKIAKLMTTDILINSEDKFPEYLAVIPVAEPVEKREINLLEFYAFLNQFPKFVRLAKKHYVEFLTYYTSITMFEAAYNLEYMLKIVKALLLVGETNARFDFHGKEKALVIGGNDNMAIIMPIFKEDRDFPIKY